MSKNEPITISLNSEVLNIIRQQAQDNYRTINAEIKMIIEKHIKGLK
jgi:hypothetical protein